MVAANYPSLSYAGPWPRNVGQVFLSFTGETALDGAAQNAFAIYGEYGLTPRTTLIGELRLPGDGLANPTGYVAVRRLVGMVSPSDPVALSGRLGFSEIGGDAAISVSPGIHLGHGFQSALGNGWITFDGWYHVPLDGSERATQIDSQIGTRLPGNWLLMLGASRYTTSGYQGTKITPSAALRIGNGRSLQLSYTEEFGDTPASSLEASLWMEF